MAAPDVAGARSYVAFQGPASGTATFYAESGTVPFVFGVNAQMNGAIAFDASVTVTVLPNAQVSLKTTAPLASVEVDEGNLTTTASPIGAVVVSGGGFTADTQSIAQVTIRRGKVLATGVQSIGPVSVFDGDFATTAPSIGTLSLSGAASSATLSAGSTVTMAGLTMSGGSLTLDSSPLRLTTTPVFDVASSMPRIAFLGGASVTYGGDPAYTSVAAMVTRNVTGTSSACADTNDGSGDVSCPVQCPTAYPYPLGGDCTSTVGMSTATLSGFGTVDAVGGTPGSRFCRWHPGVVQTAANGAAPTMIAGAASAKCSSLPR